MSSIRRWCVERLVLQNRSPKHDVRASMITASGHVHVTNTRDDIPKKHTFMNIKVPLNSREAQM